MSTIYYNHNHNHNNQNNKNHNLSRSMHFDLRKNKANKRQVIMNELLISNPDLLNNFHKRYSKTPGRLRMKNKTNVLHSTKYTNLLSNKNKNSRQDKLNKNLKKNNTTPIIAASLNKNTVMQYDTLSIPIVIYDPQSLTADAILKVNN